MARVDKQIARLNALEGDFVTRLVSALRRVADGYDSLFFHVSQNLNDLNEAHLSREGCELEQAAHDILALRRELSLEPASAAALFIQHCDEHNDLGNEHRLGPRRRAEALLEELPVNDIWFRADGALEELAEALGLREGTFDAENYWEWMIGDLDGVKLDVTRTHTLPPLETDTRIFRIDLRPFEPQLIETLIEKLRRLGVGCVKCGRWVYRSGEDFDLVVVREYGSS